MFWKTCLLKLLFVYNFFILNSRQNSRQVHEARQVRRFKVFLGNFGEQTTKAKVLFSFCFHSKLFIATFIVCNFFFGKWILATFNAHNFFENDFSQHLISATFCVEFARKISQLLQLFLPTTISAYKVNLFFQLLQWCGRIQMLHCLIISVLIFYALRISRIF